MRGVGGRTQILSLTSLRFFAALAIVFYHTKYTMPAFFDQPYFEKFPIGVEFFFILSGFILYYQYGGRRPLRLKEFYLKRFVRIYPVHWLTFIIWCCVFFVGWGNPLTEKLASALTNVTLTQSFFPGLVFSLGYNPVSWSLSNAVFFYALFPFTRWARVSLGVIGVVSAYLITAHLLNWQDYFNLTLFPNFNYFSPLVRIAEFCAGILTAKLFLARKRLKYATLLEILVSFTLLMQIGLTSVPYDLNQISFVFIFSSFVWVFAHEQGAISTCLAKNKLLVLLGNASFSLYMWHHLIMRFLGERLPPNLPALLAISFAIAVSIAFSVISFIFFENPTRIFLTHYLLCGSADSQVDPAAFD